MTRRTLLDAASDFRKKVAGKFIDIPRPCGIEGCRRPATPGATVCQVHQATAPRAAERCPAVDDGHVCNKPVLAKGWCETHYRRAYRHKGKPIRVRAYRGDLRRVVVRLTDEAIEALKGKATSPAPKARELLEKYALEPGFCRNYQPATGVSRRVVTIQSIRPEIKDALQAQGESDRVRQILEGWASRLVRRVA